METQTNQNRKRVLLTGAAGDIGRVIGPDLVSRGHYVRGFDCKPSDHSKLDEVITGDLADHEAVSAAVREVDVIIHLGAYKSPGNFHKQLLGPNVIGLYNIMEAARHSGVRRIVLASSVQVIFAYPRSEPRPIPTDARWPANNYALTKVWAEDIGDMYARLYELEVIAARIGWYPSDGPDVARMQSKAQGNPKAMASYLSHNDAKRFFAAAVEADLSTHGTRFHRVYAVGPGAEDRSAYDLNPGREVLGYEPKDAYPVNLPDFAAKTTDAS